MSRGGLERPGPPGGGVPTLFDRILGPGAPWGRFGAGLGRLWEILGRVIERLGTSWGVLERLGGGLWQIFLAKGK